MCSYLCITRTGLLPRCLDTLWKRTESSPVAASSGATVGISNLFCDNEACQRSLLVWWSIATILHSLPPLGSFGAPHPRKVKRDAIAASRILSYRDLMFATMPSFFPPRPCASVATPRQVHSPGGLSCNRANSLSSTRPIFHDHDRTSQRQPHPRSSVCPDRLPCCEYLTMSCTLFPSLTYLGQQYICCSNPR